MVIMLVVFSGVVIGISDFYLSMASSYGVTGYQNVSFLSQQKNASKFLVDTYANISSRQGVLETMFTAVGIGWGILIQVINLPNTFATIVYDMSNAFGFGIPTWFTWMIIAIITTYILFKVAGAIFGKDL